MSTRDRIAYHLALAEWLKTYDSLQAEAQRLGEPPPVMPESQPLYPRTKGRRKGSKTQRRTNIQSLSVTAPSSNGKAPKITIDVAALTRTQLCLAILRHAGHPLETKEIIQAAQRLGHDWSALASGPDNAVHGGLGRERQLGHVSKQENGPWQLVDESIAPRLSPDGKTATMIATRRQQAGMRRERLLSLFQGKTRKPDDLLTRMRLEPEFKTLTRASLRDDLGSLIAEGRLRKIRFGEYRQVN